MVSNIFLLPAETLIGVKCIASCCRCQTDRSKLHIFSPAEHSP